MATVAPTSRLAATAMAGPASRLLRRGVAGASRPGATLPGGPASGLRTSARYESPLVARIASDDDARSIASQVEDKPFVFSCFIFYPEDLWFIVPLSVLALSTLLGCLYILDHGPTGRQYWLLYIFTYAIVLFCCLSPSLRIGFTRWQRRERKRSLKRKQQE